MTATIRYRISAAAARVIEDSRISSVLAYFGRTRPTYLIPFSIKIELPARIMETWRLLQSLRGICNCQGKLLGEWAILPQVVTPEAGHACDLLRRKLMLCLGLPAEQPGTGFDPEEGFLEPVVAYPADLDAWRVYADWLQDRDDVACQVRGEVMAGWLNPAKALKISRGVPVINGRALKY